MKTSPHHFIASLAFCLAALLAASAVWAGDLDGLSEGQAAFNAGNYELAVAKWSELATTGHSDAQVFIGLAYANGWGVAKNPRLASMWYEKAAKNDNPSGQFLLGVYYISSADKLETATGLMWLRRAATNGDDAAQRFLERARARGWFKDLLPAQGSNPPPADAAPSHEQQVAVITASESDDSNPGFLSTPKE